MTQLEKDLEDFKLKWIGRRVKIIGIKHPHIGSCGVISSVDHTTVGYGMRIEIDGDKDGCYVFNGSEIQVIH